MERFESNKFPETPEEKIERLTSEVKGLKEDNERLRQMSTYDMLTGVLNRRGGREEIELIAADVQPLENGREKRQERKNGRKISLLLLDIDDFKKINDTYGHDVGDLVLKKAAEFLRGSVRKYDVVARWGGEEFLAAFQADAQSVINKFFDKSDKAPRISLDVETDSGTIKVTFSGGVTDYRHGESLDRAVERADKAMYESKKGGKNKITKYHDDAKAKLTEG